MPLAPIQDWSQWYGATTPKQEAMYIRSWADETATLATYREILSERIEKASVLPDGLGAGVVAESEAALDQLDVTLTTSDYAEWVTAHQAVYAAHRIAIRVTADSDRAVANGDRGRHCPRL